MTITLTPEHERIIQAQLATGRFRSVDELDKALAALKPQGPETAEEDKAAKAQAAAERIRELRKGVSLDRPKECLCANTRISDTSIKWKRSFSMSRHDLPWCCEDEATAASGELLRRAARRGALHVPSLWPWEMMNAVAVSVRRQRITADRARQFFEQLEAFDFHIAPAPAPAEFARLSLLASHYRFDCL
jgi:Arc/MetJ-type ribon-helix-helix transcriptional regulator